MTAEAILTAVLRLNLLGSVAIVLILALRPLVLHRLGARIAYWFWLVVPMAAGASILPAREQVVIAPAPDDPPAVMVGTHERAVDVPAAPVRASARAAAARRAATPALADVILALWLAGAGTLLTRSILRTRSLAADPSVGPALVGVLRPKLVLPADFSTRFGAEERALILAHEEVHRVSRHAVVNALVELARCANWFNPLAHLAAGRLRIDQELACDAAVIAARPTARRAYAEALLKAQLAPSYLPLGCAWTSASAGPLGERITMLGHPSLSRGAVTVGAATVAIVGLALGYAGWAQQPPRLVTQSVRPEEAAWTAAAEAPEGVLSHALEGRRHDLFIELARAGDIDLVFFGTTDTEMWWWDRGREVWDREFGALKAVNFGAQGTQPRSLLWRMRNGELDGYAAKLIVLQAWAPADRAIPDDGRAEFIEGFVPIIAEIRARQPQARLLLMAPLPRGQVGLAPWRQRAQSVDAALAEIADDETVFFTNIGERFFNPDGSFKRETWSAGRQKPGFEIWAEALQPWLDRFVR